jgi:hypothetical protein
VQNICNHETLRSARAKLQWFVNTRPDIADPVSLLAQVIPDQYEQEHAKHNAEVNKIIRYVQRNPYVLTYLTLDLPSAQLVVYADASYASITDRSS